MLSLLSQAKILLLPPPMQNAPQNKFLFIHIYNMGEIIWNSRKEKSH